MKKVLIIGAGPAGLTAAYELLKTGEYDVTVLERRVKGHVPGLTPHTVSAMGNVKALLAGCRSHPPSLLTTDWFRPASG